MKDIKAIFFDFDATLGNRYVTSYNAINAFFEEFYPEVEDGTVLREAMVQDYLTYEQFGNGTRNYAIDRIVAKYKLEVRCDDFSNWWFTNQAKYTVLFDDTIETLEKLKGKYKLGIVTNGGVSPQSTKIRNAGIEKYFETIVISGAYEFSKPDVRLFQIACDNLKVKPEESIYVGDTFGNDILGAYNAGMIPIWIWSDKVSRPITHCNVRRIYKLTELLDILEEDQ